MPEASDGRRCDQIAEPCVRHPKAGTTTVEGLASQVETSFGDSLDHGSLLVCQLGACCHVFFTGHLHRSKGKRVAHSCSSRRSR